MVRALSDKDAYPLDVAREPFESDIRACLLGQGASATGEVTFRGGPWVLEKVIF